MGDYEWWRITTPFACAAITFQNNYCSETAPILRKWFLNKTKEECKEICNKRNWTIDLL